jgi:putative DNA primase/helicase
VIEPGKLNRFPGADKSPSNKAGWCKLFDDGLGGVYGDFSTGLSATWQATREKPYSQAERDAFKQQIGESRRQAEAEEMLRHAEAATKSSLIMKSSPPASDDFPYLNRKGIKANGAKLHEGKLVIPMREDVILHSLQFIAEDGDKRFLSGGRVSGCYFSIGTMKAANALCITEGFATGATVHESTGYPVAVAFTAGNLEAVAKGMRTKFPDLSLIVCADDDYRTPGNPGLTKATIAALAVNGRLAVPEFGSDRPDGASDFNDMAQLCGKDSIAKAIASANRPVRADRQTEVEIEADRYDIAMEPEPLRAFLAPAEDYPVTNLGEILGGAATALHESVKAPLAMCCQSVLAAASLAVQPHFDIKLPWGERKPLSLFLLTVGESGERKSGIDDLVLGAAKAQERKDMEFHALELERYASEKASWDQAVDAARKATTSGKKGSATADDLRVAEDRCGEKPVAPVAPIRFVTDPTVEGLYKLLVTGQPSVALFSDEGGLLIGGHALNSDNALKTFARWCKLWDGAAFDRVRAGDGAGILYGRRMALHQLAQPEVMVKLLSDPMANGQGLLARCLVAWPMSTIGTRHTEHFEWAGDRREMKRLYAVLKALMEAQPRTGGSVQELDPVELPLSEDAKVLAVNASNEFESLMAHGADLAELRDRTAKALENACRIAGILAVIDKGLAAREIDSEYLQRGLVLVQWYLAEALRIRGASAIPQSVTDAEFLSLWLKDHNITKFRSKQILRSGPNQIRNKPRLVAAITELRNSGYLAENDPGELVDGVRARKSWKVLHHVV